MSRHYSTRDFFRQIPNALLARYFGERGLLAEFDFAAMSETRVEPLFDAWLQLSDEKRKAAETEFRSIFELASEKGFCAIRDEAQFQFRRDPEALAVFTATYAALESHFERAMLAFLDHPAFWAKASLFYHADILPYWRKRKGLPRVDATADSESIRSLADAIRTHFHRTEGRGNNCLVETLRRGDRDYFFAYPQDYSQKSVEWVEGALDRRPHNPAFEVVFVYCKAEGTLDLNCPGAKKPTEALQQIFAKTILKLDELPPNQKDERVYDLNPLVEKGFAFVFRAESGIESVAIRKLRLSSKVNSDRLTLEADSADNPDAIYDLLARVGKGTPLRLYNVTQVELVARIKAAPDQAARSATMRISYPNSCSLKYEGLDGPLRDMLHASGIEPKEGVSPAGGGDAALAAA